MLASITQYTITVNINDSEIFTTTIEKIREVLNKEGLTLNNVKEEKSKEEIPHIFFFIERRIANVNTNASCLPRPVFFREILNKIIVKPYTFDLTFSAKDNFGNTISKESYQDNRE